MLRSINLQNSKVTWLWKSCSANLIWLVVSTPLKNIGQLGLLFPIYGKTKNVPNHQPTIVCHNHSYIVTIVIYHSYRGTIFQVLRLLIHSCHRCFPPKQRKVAKQEDCSEIWSPRSSQPAPIRHEDKTMTQTPSAFGFMMFYVRCLSHFETFKCWNLQTPCFNLWRFTKMDFICLSCLFAQKDWFKKQTVWMRGPATCKKLGANMCHWQCRCIWETNVHHSNLHRVLSHWIVPTHVNEPQPAGWGDCLCHRHPLYNL